MLHTIIRGKSLLETVHMNLLTRDLVERVAKQRWGRPVWEGMPEGPDDPRIEDLTTSYLGRLVPISRGIKLNSGTAVTLVNGCSYPKLPRREPAATVIRRRTDQQLAYLGIDLAKHPWRELGSILVSSVSTAEGGPWVLAHLAPSEGHVDLWAGGFAANQAKLLDVAEWSFALPLALIGKAELSKYREGAELAERASWRLGQAIKAYFGDLSVGEFKRNDKQSLKQRRRVLAKAAASFWRTLDGSYGRLIEAANDRTADLGAAWYPTVSRAMNDAYDLSCPHESPRQIQAFAQGKKQLWLKRPWQGDAANAA